MNYIDSAAAGLRRTPEQIVARLADGMTGIVGSFSCRIDPPHDLLAALLDSGLRNLTRVVLALSNDSDLIGMMAQKGMVSKIVTGFNNANEAVELLRCGARLEVEYVPYGTLVERVRLAAGGIAAFFSPTGVGTCYADGKETRNVNGREYILEQTIGADFALIRGWQADACGNIRYWPSARHLNHYAAGAARFVAAQVDEYVDQIAPADVGTSSIYIDSLCRSAALTFTSP